MMMMMMNVLSFHKMRPFHLKQFKLLNNQIPTSTCYKVQAMTKGKEDSSESSQDYEIDRDKAREALKKLDQQLQSLSTKQVPSPKLRASDVKFEEGGERVEINVNMRAKKDFEISDSFLGYTAVALVLFTIFYNFLFYTVIAPAIDGPS